MLIAKHYLVLKAGHELERSRQELAAGRLDGAWSAFALAKYYFGSSLVRPDGLLDEDSIDAWAAAAARVETDLREAIADLERRAA